MYVKIFILKSCAHHCKAESPIGGHCQNRPICACVALPRSRVVECDNLVSKDNLIFLNLFNFDVSYAIYGSKYVVWYFENVIQYELEHLSPLFNFSYNFYILLLKIVTVKNCVKRHKEC